MSMINSSDTIGNRTRDLPACSLVPQPATLPLASRRWVGNLYSHFHLFSMATCLHTSQVGVSVTSVG